MRVVVSGGGTGGHTYPAVTTIEAVRERASVEGLDVDVVWVGTATGLEARIAHLKDISFHPLVAGKLRRTGGLRASFQNFLDAFRVLRGVGQAIAFTAKHHPDVVFTTGGYAAVPMGVAAWLLRRPLVMHEQIHALGLANRILALLATEILLSQPSSLEHLSARGRSRAVVTGNPIRSELLTGTPQAARDAFRLDPVLPIVYVTGGAQGSVQVNRLLTAALPELLPHAQVLHQSGRRSFGAMQEVAQSLPADLRPRYHVVEFIDAELADVLAAADIVVSRSGAGTVAELTALGKSCIFIPLVPTAGDEQQRNATHLANAGAARVLSGASATPQRLLAELLDLLRDPEARTALGAAARQHGRPEAAAVVARILLSDTFRPASSVPR